MKARRFTLVAEGTSDRVLLPILRWMMLRHHPEFEWLGQIANLQELPNPPRALANKIAMAGKLFAADVIFIHRDADRESPSLRQGQIAAAIGSLPESPAPNWVPVIPVRMTEAWLLVSESALRAAAGNPNGRVPLNVPQPHRLETIPDPKKLLQSLLIEASELAGRRRKKFNFPANRLRIPEFVEDWETLLLIPSAKALFDHVASLKFFPPTAPCPRL